MRKKLNELTARVKVLYPDSVSSQTDIRAVTSDSRQAGPGVLFVAVAGLTVDGHDYVEDALRRGCPAVIVEKGRGGSQDFPGGSVRLVVDDTRIALGRVAAAFWDNPSSRLTMVGITGTNGKTTSAYLLEAVIRKAGGNPGVIGTVNYRYNGLELPAPHTTPDPVSLQQLLRRMADAGVTHVIMEASSHALAQKRLEGVGFDVALFTNLSRDHLDFHGDMEQYFFSKKLLFQDCLKEKARAVVLTEPVENDRSGGRSPGSSWGDRLVDELHASGPWRKLHGKNDLTTCGGPGNHIAVRDFREGLDGIDAVIETPAGTIDLHSPLIGEFNLRNLLGVIGVALALDITPETIRAALSVAGAAPGRLQPVGPRRGARVFVDYAHTPDALENVLKTLRKLAAGRLIVIFGCGGDRDRGKRPQMGSIAGRLADVAVVTSDNPRSERPDTILADIEKGLIGLGIPRMRLETLLHRKNQSGYDLVLSRREAIRIVMRHAAPDDLILISGKGHETYQQTREGRAFFDDRVFAGQEAAVVKW